MKITRSTKDAQLAALETEEILKRFDLAKTRANAWDAERDRLRKYIQEHVNPGRHRSMLLELEHTSERIYCNSLGNAALETCIILAPGGDDVNSKTHTIQGTILDNETLYSKKGSIKIKLMEVPDGNE